MTSKSYLKNALLKDKMPGSWDVEVCHQGEADLWKHHILCQKHPDHKEFIPVDTFDITHLPTDYQDRDIVEYIKLVAQLTVRLTVRYVSPDRPATVPGTDTPYPGYKNRGRFVTSLGTGLIAGFNYLSNVLLIKTAAHVVFDYKEAQHTSCHLFYDNGGKPSACKGALELKCRFDMDTYNPITDESVLKCKIDDISLRDKLESKMTRLFELYKIIKERFVRMSDLTQNQPLTFIVSHPHGCSKTISLGRCVEVDDNLDDVRFLYTTPTCPGSSGAAVICLDKEASNLNIIHSGTWKNDTSLNLGSCRYAPLNSSVFTIHSDLKNSLIDSRLEDSQWLLPCDPPPECDYNLMYDYINTWSYLCVFVDVYYVSEQRPEFWPGSKLPYPWYKERGSGERRWGRSWVDRVDIFPNQFSPDKTCDCDICSKSSTPERNFAYIYLLTSTSLVFDQTEGINIAHLNVAEYFPPVTPLNNLSRTQPVCSNVETDRCQLMFVTHSLVYAETLISLIEHVSFLKDKIQDKLSHHLSTNPISIKIGIYGDATVGRSVRVGKHLVYKDEAGEDDVGAPVIVLGNKDLHVDVSGHTGQYSLDPKYGYSRYLDYQYKSTPQLKNLITEQEKCIARANTIFESINSETL